MFWEILLEMWSRMARIWMLTWRSRASNLTRNLSFRHYCNYEWPIRQDATGSVIRCNGVVLSWEIKKSQTLY